MPEVPEMVIPSMGSTIAFTIIIAFIAIAFVLGVWRGGSEDQTPAMRKRWGLYALIGMLAWLAVGAVVPISRVLETEMMPPPAMIFLLFCFVLAFAVAFSPFGTRLVQLPFAALVGFHAFRVPLEMVLHNWYGGGTLPVQMTWSGHNFDVATGVLAIIIGIGAILGRASRASIWLFNIVGSLLLLVVITIAIASSPLSIRQYMNDPPVLLAFYFPYGWIASVAVSCACLWHVVLFRKLAARESATRSDS